MVLRILLGSVVSALVLLAWSFLFWVLLSAPGGVARAVPDEASLMQLLDERLPASGTYYFPSPPRTVPGEDEKPALEAFRRRAIVGPTGMIQFRRGGRDPLSPINYALDFVQLLAGSLVAAVLLSLVLPVTDTFTRRAAFVFGLGVFGAVAVRLSDPVWWHLPWEHFLHSALFDVVGWLVAGLALAGIVKPSRGLSHYTDPSKPLWKRALDVE